MQRVLKPAKSMLAAINFMVDAVFMTVAKPFISRITEQRIFGSLRVWIISLRPYPTLALFAVPIIVLEPVKPVAAYLAGTGHIATGMTILAVGEFLKLVLVERLFSISHDKLMSIPAFAWTYRKYRQTKEWLVSVGDWQAIRRWRRRPIRLPKLRSGSESLPEAGTRLVQNPLTLRCDTFFIF